MKLKVGDVVRVNAADRLLLEEDGTIGEVVKVDKDSPFFCCCDFRISFDVPMEEDEIVEVLTKEEFPEHYL